MRPPLRPPEINVTPLVDVVLVLLIIFMVVIPQLEAGAAIDLPGAKNPDPRTDVERAAIVVNVTRAGDVMLDKQPIARQALVPQLRALRRAQPERPLRLKGDRLARYDQVRDVFRDCQAVGFPGVALEVGKPDDEEGK
jgi:biopolymer transport protein TolR